MDKMTVYLDADNVIMNQMEPWLDYVRHKFKSNLTMFELTQYNTIPLRHGLEAHAFWKTHGYYSTFVHPYDDAQEWVDYLKSLYNVSILTWTYPKVEAEKTLHLKNLFDVKVIHANDQMHKYEFSRGGVLIDDCYPNLRGHAMHNRQHGILYNRNGQHPWARSEKYGYDRFFDFIKPSKTYEEINVLLKEIDQGEKR